MTKPQGGVVVVDFCFVLVFCLFALGFLISLKKSECWKKITNTPNLESICLLTGLREISCIIFNRTVFSACVFRGGKTAMHNCLVESYTNFFYYCFKFTWMCWNEGALETQLLRRFPLGIVGCRACSKQSSRLLYWKGVKATNQQSVVPLGGGAGLSNVPDINWFEPPGLDCARDKSVFASKSISRRCFHWSTAEVGQC